MRTPTEHAPPTTVRFEHGTSAFDQRDRPSDRPSEVDGLARSLPQQSAEWGATRRFTPPAPINCAGGVKRGSKEIEPYGPSLSTGSRTGGPPSKFQAG